MVEVPHCLLWVQALCPRGRERNESRARRVHQDGLRIARDRAGDAQPLLLPARQRGAAVMEAILDLVPQPRLAQRLFDGGVELRLRSRQPVDARAISDILEDRFGERSEEHTSELQSLMRISYAVFCLYKNKKTPST